jgi:hypothetical protein
MRQHLHHSADKACILHANTEPEKRQDRKGIAAPALLHFKPAAAYAATWSDPPGDGPGERHTSEQIDLRYGKAKGSAWLTRPTLS